VKEGILGLIFGTTLNMKEDSISTYHYH